MLGCALDLGRCHSTPLPTWCSSRGPGKVSDLSPVDIQRYWRHFCSHSSGGYQHLGRGRSAETIHRAQDGPHNDLSAPVSTGLRLRSPTAHVPFAPPGGW